MGSRCLGREGNETVDAHTGRLQWAILSSREVILSSREAIPSLGGRSNTFRCTVFFGIDYVDCNWATQNHTKLTNNSPPESHFHIYKALVYHINQTLQASPKFNLRGVLVTCGPEAQ